MTNKLYTDGGARGNPGPAGIGGVLYDESGSEILTFKEYIGEETNNAAEYKALIRGLMMALGKGIKNLDCFLDSELVVKQLNGQYKIKNENLKGLSIEVTQLRNQFDSITFNHVKRAENKLADKLVNEALDERG